MHDVRIEIYFPSLFRTSIRHIELEEHCSSFPVEEQLFIKEALSDPVAEQVKQAFSILVEERLPPATKAEIGFH